MIEQLTALAPLFAAITAGAAFASVVLSFRQWREQRQPLLIVVIEEDAPLSKMSGRLVFLRVYNDGGGPARNITLSPGDVRRWMLHPSVEFPRESSKGILRAGQRWTVRSLGENWQVRAHARQIGPLEVTVGASNFEAETTELDPVDLYPDAPAADLMRIPGAD